MDRAYWLALGGRAAQDIYAWSAFVAATEFLWQDAALVKDSDAWQALWFELEIVNALALAEWMSRGDLETGRCAGVRIISRMRLSWRGGC